jgi:hypothetical protein
MQGSRREGGWRHGFIWERKKMVRLGFEEKGKIKK